MHLLNKELKIDLGMFLLAEYSIGYLKQCGMEIADNVLDIDYG